MHFRDWVLTVLFACLVALAALLRRSTAVVVLLGTAGVCLLLLGVDLIRSRNTRHRRAHGVDAETPLRLPIPQTPTQSDGALGAFEVTITREEFHNFRYDALILESQISIRNRTDQVQRIGGFFWQHEAPWNEMVTNIDARREEQRLKEQRSEPPHTIDPDSIVSGWLVIVFPHHADLGEPGYTVGVHDLLGHEYGAHRVPRPR